MADPGTGLLVGINAFLVALIAIAVTNQLGWRRLAAVRPASAGPTVSVLVPARNEARNIVRCVVSLLALNYAPLEVIVLDDASTDGTADLVRDLAAHDPRLRLLPGRPLPAGWLGKHWACEQLAEAARGELLLFTDADTWHGPGALGAAVATLVSHDADLVSALPHQELGTWGERLVVPILPFCLFSCFPMAIIERWPWWPLVMAVGQFMLFRRAAYARSGGHAAVRTCPTDDVALARRLVARGGRWRLVDAGTLVSCRMYRGFGPAVAGFSRSLLPALGGNPGVFAAIWAWLALVFLWPPAVLALSVGQAALPALAVSATCLALALWALVVRRFGLPPWLALAYPVVMGLAVAVAARSLAVGLTGRATWKGRPVAVSG
jgi:chlorobactene glucosyltransferase